MSIFPISNNHPEARSLYLQLAGANVLTAYLFGKAFFNYHVSIKKDDRYVVGQYVLRRPNSLWGKYFDIAPKHRIAAHMNRTVGVIGAVLALAGILAREKALREPSRNNRYSQSEKEDVLTRISPISKNPAEAKSRSLQQAGAFCLAPHLVGMAIFKYYVGNQNDDTYVSRRPNSYLGRHFFDIASKRRIFLRSVESMGIAGAVLTSAGAVLTLAGLQRNVDPS
jgi:hypothetical protein